MPSQEDAEATVRHAILYAMSGSGERFINPEQLVDAIYAKLFSETTRWAVEEIVTPDEEKFG